MPSSSPRPLSNHAGPASVPVAAFLDAVGEPLRGAGLVDESDLLFLRLRPRNPLRRDYPERFDFEVLSSERIVCHLAVGHDLRDLRARTEAFSAACPRIAVRPLLWHSAGGWDFLFTEYFAGVPVSVAAGTDAFPRIEGQIETVLAALQATAQSSEPAALAAEFAQFRSAVVALPEWGRLDRVLLDEIVFPFIEAGLLSVRPEGRWTNGDFIPDNVLVAADGSVRLVDYEFAQRTHFFALDAWRWRRFAGSGVRGHGLAPELPAPPAWLEALGILQHMVMLHAIHPGSAAYADCLLCVRELFAALTRGHARFRGEMLLRHLVTSQDFRPVGQLFWSSDGVFSEPCSACLSYEPESGTVLRFTIGAHHGPLHLRFDPADRAGLIAISAARIIRESDGVRLVDRDATQIAETSAAAGDILLLEPTGSANYLSLGPDPQLRLHPFDLGGEPQSLRCEIDLRFSHGLAPLATLLPRDQASLLTARRETEKLQCRIAEMQLRHDELVQSLHAQNEALLDHEHRNRRAAAERASLQEELQEARHRIGDLDAVIVSKVEQIAVALDRANMFDQKLAAATAELEHIRAQLAASQALLQRFARLEKRALVRFDHLVRGEKPLSRQVRVP